LALPRGGVSGLRLIIVSQRPSPAARDVLREAKLEAERCRYQSRVGSITNKLADLKDELEV
jgi:hypothetical protein